MPYVVTFEDYRPSPRYDSLPWTEVRINEGTASIGPWGLIETIPLTPVDADPSRPAVRNFTTQLATAPDLWYQLVFADADQSVGLPMLPVQNVADDRPVYASTTELAGILHVTESQRHAALLRVLKAAALEIDNEIGTADIYGTSLPYSNPPALVTAVNLDRAHEHWKQMEVPFGIMELGLNVQYTARDSWERHAYKLNPLKASWGVA